MLFQRDQRDDLFALSSDEYLQKFNVRCYLNDMVRLLLESRDEKPLEFISEYFLTVAKGTHVTHRAYEYIKATLHNRAAFCMLLRIVFDPKDFQAGLKIEDFAQLVYLLCPDLPYYMFKKVYSVVGPEDDGLPALMQAMGIHVYFAEFLNDLDTALQPADGLVPRELLSDATVTQVTKAKPAPDGDGAVTESAPTPPRDTVHLAFKNAAQRADVSADVSSEHVLLDHILVELYTSAELLQHISHRHPALHASLCKGGGVDGLVGGVVQAHDTMVASGRQRRQKTAK
eukprot:TRINITY_DN16821_c0_g1_i1.p2 TRINITY_DN16821_c0_g1~~TRINITY_DN16821_c0_g1_i1.p2  ORF type:complete len:286 (+),score=119.88 TRINITY_DN16821_c0_g1_i1:96-953(+)